MKRIAVLSASLLLMLTVLFGAVGCVNPPSTSTGNNSNSSSSSVVGARYSVTFKQEGQEDVVKYVEEGKALTDIPTPVPVQGYTVVWEEKDLTNVTADITVVAVKTANTYTITFDMGQEGIPAIQSMNVTYGETFTLPTLPTQYVGANDCYDLLEWRLDGVKVESGAYTWTKNITLVAKWSYSYGTDPIV